MKRGLIQCLMILFMLVLVIPMTARAETNILVQGVCGDDLTWKLDSNYVLTISGEGDMRNFQCIYDGPEDIFKNCPWVLYRYDIKKIVIEEGVTSIGAWAFNECLNVEEVILPNSLTSIGMGAFYYCKSIKELDMPASLKYVGEGAFIVCTGLEKVNITDLAAWCAVEMEDNSSLFFYGGSYFGAELYLNGKMVTDLVIPEGVTSIGNGVFGAKSIQSISIPASVTSIGGGNAVSGSVYITDLEAYCAIDFGGAIANGAALYINNEQVTQITIPNGITCVKNYAFGGFGSLTSVSIPESVTTIGTRAFAGSSISAIDIPDSVKVIDRYAFAYCENLKSVKLPMGLETISSSLFVDCTKLEQLRIPDSVTGIEKYAFSGCKALKDLQLSAQLSTIGSGAFYNCTALTKLVLPGTVTQIGKEAFINCTNLQEVYGANAAAWCNIVFEDLKANPMYYATKLFLNNVLATDVVIPDSVTALNNYAFYHCTYLTNVVVGNGVTSIGKDAFYGCSNLQSVQMGQAVAEIGRTAFSGCKTLKNVYWLGDAPSVAEDAFAGVNATCWYPAGNTTYTVDITTADFGGELVWTYEGETLGNQCGPNAFWQITENGTLIISGSGEMFDYAVNDKQYAPWYESRGTITAIEIGDSITHIGNGAFLDCVKAKTLVWGKNVISIGSKAFKGCAGLKSIEVPVGITAVGSYAFADCAGITSAVLPDSLTYIPEGIFSGCKVLVNVTLPQYITTIGDSAFSGCYGLASLVLPEGLTSIGKYAFSMCGSANMSGGYYPYSNFTSITLPSTLITIGERAFSACEMLTSIVIPDSVTVIEDSAFAYCYKLKTITISANIERIGRDAFFQCKKMTTVTFKWNAPILGSSALDPVTNSATCYYPANNEAWSASVVEAYKNSQSKKLTWVAIEMEKPEEGTGGGSGGNAGDLEGDDSNESGGENGSGTNQPENPGEGPGSGNSGSGNQGGGSGGSGENGNGDQNPDGGDGDGGTVGGGTGTGSDYMLIITQQPADAYAALGDNYCVTVEVEGEGLKYQWYFRNAGSDVWYKSSVRDNTYDDVMTIARAGREVYCVITDAYGNKVTTDIVKLIRIAKEELQIVTQPVNDEAALDEIYSVTVVAKGEGLKYQWYFRNEGSDTWYKSSVRTDTYTNVMTKARAGREIYCVITDALGNTVTTDVVKLIRVPKEELQIVVQPSNAQAALGDNYCVSVVAQGEDLKYQWYFRNAGTDTWYKSSVRDNTYDDVMTKARAGREVYCVITDAFGNTVTTDVVKLIRVPKEELKLTSPVADSFAAMGENYCVTVNAQGEGLKYTWYFRNAGSDVWYRSGVTDNTYDDVMTKARANREVYCVITDALGNTITTEIVKLVCISGVTQAQAEELIAMCDALLSRVEVDAALYEIFEDEH